MHSRPWPRPDWREPEWKQTANDINHLQTHLQDVQQTIPRADLYDEQQRLQLRDQLVTALDMIANIHDGWGQELVEEAQQHVGKDAS